MESYKVSWLGPREERWADLTPHWGCRSIVAPRAPQMVEILAVPRLTRRVYEGVAALIYSVNPDYVLLTGGVEEAPLLRELAKTASARGVRLLGVPSNRDDHYIARLIREVTGYDLEGHIVYLGEDTFAAGIGGREPIANISSIAREAREAHMNVQILVSYYPPYGVCDSGSLPGIHYGLIELWDLAKILRPLVVVSALCACPILVNHKGTRLLCLPASWEECAASIRVAGGKQNIGLNLDCSYQQG